MNNLLKYQKLFNEIINFPDKMISYAKDNNLIKDKLTITLEPEIFKITKDLYLVDLRDINYEGSLLPLKYLQGFVYDEKTEQIVAILGIKSQKDVSFDELVKEDFNISIYQEENSESIFRFIYRDKVIWAIGDRFLNLENQNDSICKTIKNYLADIELDLKDPLEFENYCLAFSLNEEYIFPILSFERDPFNKYYISEIHPSNIPESPFLTTKSYTFQKIEDFIFSDLNFNLILHGENNTIKGKVNSIAYSNDLLFFKEKVELVEQKINNFYRKYVASCVDSKINGRTYGAPRQRLMAAFKKYKFLDILIDIYEKKSINFFAKFYNKEEELDKLLNQINEAEDYFKDNLEKFYWLKK